MPVASRAHNAEGLLGIFNVWDRGAVGDGQHDDAGGIQAAILAAGASGGGLVAIPAGTYRLGSNVVWGNATNVTIWQHSGATFTGPGALPAAAGSNATRVEPSGVTVGGLPTTSAVGDAAAAGATGIAADVGHLHGREAFGVAAVVQAFGDAAAAGAATTPARSDHRHGLPAPINQLTNGGHDIAQRPLPVATNGAYATDRWQLVIAGTDTLSVNVDATVANRRANSRQAAALAFALGTGAGASGYRQILRIADGYHHLLGQPFSTRLPARSTVANAIRAYLTTDGTGGATGFSGFHSGGGGYENLDLPNIVVPADATFVELGYRLAASGTFYVDNGDGIPGGVAAEFLALSPQEELARCLRYYQRLDANGGTTAMVGTGYCISATQALINVPLQARMGGTPSLTLSAAGHFVVASSSNQVATAISLYAAHPENPTLLVTVAAGLVAGQGCMLQVNTTAAWLAFEFNP